MTPRLAIYCLAVAQTVIWAGIFYSFPALLLRWEDALPFSKTALTGAFTAAVAASAGLSWRDAGADALVLLTNDGWWLRSTFAPWHAKMLGSRARELNVPIARAANSGVSSHTDRDGAMRAKLGMSQRDVLQVDVMLAERPMTFYTRVGDWAFWLILAVVFGALLRPWLPWGSTRG